MHWSYHTIDWDSVHRVSNIDKLFITLNNRPHLHRCLLLDGIYKHSLQNYGNISWNVKADYSFEYFNNQLLQLDEFNSQWVMPAQQFSSLFNIIAESNLSRIDITEKTYYAMLCKKPILLLAKQGINKRLEHFGFKLLDCIDYSFDSEPDINVRIDLLLEQLKHFKNTDYNELYNQMLPTIQYNYDRLITIVNSRLYVPERFYDIYLDIKDLKTNYSPGVVKSIYETTLSNTNC